MLALAMLPTQKMRMPALAMLPPKKERMLVLAVPPTKSVGRLAENLFPS